MEIKDTVNNTGTTAEGSAAGKGMSDVRRILTLAVGDILVFLIFAMLGRRSHGEAAGFDALWQIVVTAAPFLIGWFLVAPWLGAYRRGLETSPASMVRRTLLAWVCAWPVGHVLRMLWLWHIPEYTFFLVTLVTNAILLLVWRWPFALVNSARKH
ncbi:MAG: DUF3054 domain-containing protein [Ktedonobacteraceae bacterium]|nr:DUF3054 domain-containing protein [Ktedonobacteraceae bacterium]